MAGPAQGERVAKLLAQRGLCSRRQAEALIVAGQVQVNGQVHRELGLRVPPDADICLVQAARERLAAQVTVLLHKPLGIVSTQPEGAQVPAWRLLTAARCYEPQGAGVSAVLAAPHSLAVCGRLDQDSRGLLVMTQDGVLAKQITGTRTWEKHYRVQVHRPVTSQQLRLLRELRRLDDGPILPMGVERLSADTVGFVLREGRKHHLRRACAAVGLTVIDLLRERIGPFALGDLPEGGWRVVALPAGLVNATGRP